MIRLLAGLLFSIIGLSTFGVRAFFSRTFLQFVIELPGTPLMQAPIDPAPFTTNDIHRMVA
jgi:hypothetical protein